MILYQHFFSENTLNWLSSGYIHTSYALSKIYILLNNMGVPHVMPSKLLEIYKIIY